jgi:hypothetical protein
MREWQYGFNAVTKSEWFAQIQQDLKGQSVESLTGEWWPGEPILPFLHAEDKDWPAIRLSDEIFQRPPVIIEYVDARQSANDTINARILEGLLYGAQHVQIHCQPDQLKHSSAWLQDVLMDMVRIEFLVDDSQPGSESEGMKSIPAGCKWRATVSGKNEIRIDIAQFARQTGNNHLSNFCFAYEIPSGGNFIEQAIQAYQSLTDDIRALTEAGFDKMQYLDAIVWKLSADSDYFKHLIQLRVLHLLWRNFYQLQTRQDIASAYLESHMMMKQDEKPDQYLIRGASNALAAALGGAQAVCISTPTISNSPTYYHRINRNINHLLHLESGLPPKKDPMAGAWVPDYYTYQWTKRIWEALGYGN